MSQQLTPVNGGTQIVETTLTTPLVGALSRQYVQANNLESRPTEWITGGRPIYRRLPAISETYQIDFFNIVPTSNTAVQDDTRVDIGYVYVPWGEGINGPVSMEVVSSDSKGDLLIKSGRVVWQYGTSSVLPAIVNLETLGIESGRWLVAYQLVYDDYPTNFLYEVENFSLAGQPLTLTASTDSSTGWRFAPRNAFLNTTTTFWSNKDTYFPDYVQPTSCYLDWSSELSSAYSKIVLRCPPNTAYTGTATLSYIDGTATIPVGVSSVDRDSTGQFFEFNITSPTLQNQWNIVWSSLDMSIQSINVTGIVTQTARPSGLAPRSSLVIYPENNVPETIQTPDGRTIPATYCRLAYVDVNNLYQVEKILDLRYIIHRDYQPVADWLTEPFDNNLINLYDQVKSYSPLWMSPVTCMDQEYANLETDQVEVVR